MKLGIGYGFLSVCMVVKVFVSVNKSGCLLLLFTSGDGLDCCEVGVISEGGDDS